MCTLQKRLPRAHISMLHDKEVSSVTFWVVLSYSSIPSVFYASLHAIWGLHSGDEVLNFSWIYWLLFFSLVWIFFFFFSRNTQRVRECRKPSKLAQAFRIILLNVESCLAQGQGCLFKHIRFTTL